MRKAVLVYGSRMLAEMLYYDSQGHPDFKIAGFALDQNYLEDKTTWLGLPLVAFERVEQRYPSEEYDMLVVTASYDEMRNRDHLNDKAKAKGYQLTNYISANSRVAPTVKLGDNNIIFEQVHLGLNGVMGSNNTIRQQVYLGHDFVLGDKNVITPGCTIGGSCKIANSCYIGLHATVLNNIQIAEETLVGAGSVVIKDTVAYSKNVGNPSRVIGMHKEDGLKVRV
ncbi:hypothetical protein N9260_00140 [bacterium]|nr:hypothetical protein [bacterium]